MSKVASNVGKCEMHAFLRLPLRLCRWAGVFPIEGLHEHRTCALRYKTRSPYIVYHIVTLVLQLMLFLCIVHEFVNTKISLSTAKAKVSILLCTVVLILYTIRPGNELNASLLFYSNAMVSMILLMKLARKWPRLVRRATAIEALVASIRCTKHWDRQSRAITVVIMILALVEHIFSVLFKIKLVINCTDYFVTDPGFTQLYFEKSVGFLFFYTPYTHWKAFLYEVAQIQATFLWSIIDVITVCISMYLVSYFRDLNRLIEERYEKNVRWESIRCHYSRLIELVSETDARLCLLILLSVFTNLCFICLQIFYLVNRVYPGLGDCPHEKVVLSYNSPEHYLYYSFSTVFLFVKASMMFLMASNVNNEALKPLLSLLYVPASEYTIEVQRFSRQVRYTTNALSGYLFYITRPMILQAASTIVKYELVLLQASYNDQ